MAGQPKTNHFEDLDPLQVFKAQPMDRDAFKKAQEEYLKNKQMEKQGDFWHWGELQRLLPAPKKMVPSERWKCNMG